LLSQQTFHCQKSSPETTFSPFLFAMKTSSILDQYTIYFGAAFQRYLHVHGSPSIPTSRHLAILSGRSLEGGWQLWDTSSLLRNWSSCGQRDNTMGRVISRKNMKKKHTDWTRAHAFFLIMGGFALHEGGKPVRILGPKELEELSEAGKIKWPTITKEEIADRSKGDYLSKTIVLFQTTWFVGQCIARGAYGLTVTELEVVTAAFATLTGVTYYLWWDKPLDVRCSIPVHLLDGRLGKIEGDIEKAVISPRIIPSLKISAEEITERDEKVVVNPNPLPPTSIQVDTSTPDPAPTRMQQFRAFRRAACEERGTLSGIGYVFIGFPLIRFIGAFDDMLDCKHLGGESLRVPTFYSHPTLTATATPYQQYLRYA
jgi:hypothetical protein